MANSFQKLQQNLNIWNKELQKRVMSLSKQKTKMMVVSRENVSHKIKMQGEKLEQVDCYKSVC
jgi:hypothetical protein